MCVCVLHIISRSGFNHNNMRLVANPILCGLRDICPENVEMPDRCPENVEVLHKMSRKCRSQVLDPDRCPEVEVDGLGVNLAN